MCFLRRWLLVGGFVGGCFIATGAQAGSLDFSPALEAGLGYDGNFFLDENAAARVAAFPLRGAADLALAWVPSLRGRLRAHAGYARQRLYANPDLGSVGSASGGLEGLVRPTFWSFLNLDTWAADHRTWGSTDIAFLDGTNAGAQLQGGYRFPWATLGAAASVEAAGYRQQPVTTGVDRADGYALAGLFGEWSAAGRWRADAALTENRSNFHAAAYRGGDVRLTYAHELWKGAEAAGELGWRYKAYATDARVDQRWRGAASLAQRIGEDVSVRATAAQAFNRSNRAGNQYEWTTFECVLSVAPHWSYLY